MKRKNSQGSGAVAANSKPQIDPHNNPTVENETPPPGADIIDETVLEPDATEPEGAAADPVTEENAPEETGDEAPQKPVIAESNKVELKNVDKEAPVNDTVTTAGVGKPIPSEDAVHPAAALFPMLGKQEMAALVKDIKEYGQLQPIVRYQGEILDGRNRAQACKIAGVEPKFVEYVGDSPVSFVMSSNLNRRHLEKSVRAALAVEIAPMFEAEAAKRRRAGVSIKVGEGGKSLEKAAKAVHVSTAYAEKTKKIRTVAPDKFAAIKSGKKKVSQAERELKQEAKVTQVDKEALPTSASPTVKKIHPAKKSAEQAVGVPIPRAGTKKNVLVFIAASENELTELETTLEKEIDDYDEKTMFFYPKENVDMVKAGPFIQAVNAYAPADEASPVTPEVPVKQ